MRMTSTRRSPATVSSMLAVASPALTSSRKAADVIAAGKIDEVERIVDGLESGAIF
jgi:hypothetical protein